MCYNELGGKMKFVAKYFSELTLSQLYEILKSRSEIFIMEQNMHCQDIDGVDHSSRHLFLEDGGRVVAYLRAFYDSNDKNIVRIGRVLTTTHGIGLGAKLMNKSIEDIKANFKCTKICLDSQKHAVDFYEKFGFKAVSDKFLEENVIHIAMELEL